MPMQALARESYLRLIELLDHQVSAHVLFYADTIDSSTIDVLCTCADPKAGAPARHAAWQRTPTIGRPCRGFSGPRCSRRRPKL